MKPKHNFETKIIILLELKTSFIILLVFLARLALYFIQIQQFLGKKCRLLSQKYFSLKIIQRDSTCRKNTFIKYQAENNQILAKDTSSNVIFPSTYFLNLDINTTFSSTLSQFPFQSREGNERCSRNIGLKTGNFR